MTVFDAVVAVAILFNGIAFASLGVWVARASRRTDSAPFAALSRVAALTCAAFVLGAVHRLGLQAHRLGWVTDDLGGLLLEEMQLVKSFVAAALGLVAVRAAMSMRSSLERMQRVSEALTGRNATQPLPELSTLGLTQRELEVASLIVDGHVSDSELATRLQISPHTSRTHVRNILRKAGLESRRELLLLAADHRPPPAPRRS